MKNLRNFSIAALLFAALLPAQTATPNTTLSSAQSATATTVCLTATTGVVNQTGVYVDQEYELVQISNNTTVAAGPTCVPVSRSNRGAASGPVAHASGAVAWIAYTPATSIVPGVNGFAQRNVVNTGVCTRSTQIYLPIIYPYAGIKRDCTAVSNNTAGFWTDYAPNGGLDNPSPSPIVPVATTGAFSVVSGNYVITKSSAAAVMTLAAPTAGSMDGMTIRIVSQTAQAHTLTATTLLESGASGSPYTTATFGAYIGASITLMAKNGVWMVIQVSNVVLS